MYMDKINWSTKLSSDDIIFKYFVCLYLSLLQIMGRNIFPVTNTSLVISAFNICVGLLVQGNMLGIFAEVLFEMREK